MYRKLDSTQIVTTLQRLGVRILERFPESNLNRVCAELLGVAAECETRIQRLRRPRWILRAGILFLVLALAAILTVAVLSIRVTMQVEHIAELLQGLDAGVNEIILLSLALYFLFSLENRLKQREALRALHELRSIAHVIDMHQLTKDPEATLQPEMATRSSPLRGMTRYQLSRYLDYCAEMLSLTSKLAAFYAQYLRDPVILDAVNNVEDLTSGLSHKIWQKIMILESEGAAPRRAADSAARRVESPDAVVGDAAATAGDH